jgi:hypothetical protein
MGNTKDNVTTAAPLTGKPAAYEVGQSDPGQPAAPTIGMEAPTPAAPRAPEVGGVSSFGQNVRADQNAGLIQEYRAPATRLPATINAREILNDRSNPDGCQEGSGRR